MFYFHKVAYVDCLAEVDFFSHMSEKFLPLYKSAKIIKIDQDFSKVMTTTVLPPFYDSQCTYPLAGARVED